MRQTGGVYPSMHAGGTHPTGMHPCLLSFHSCDVRTVQDRFTKELSILLRTEIHNEIGEE